MSEGDPDRPDDEPTPFEGSRFDDAVLEFMRAVESGVEPDRGELLSRYADVAGDLAAFIDDHESMRRLSQEVSAETVADDRNAARPPPEIPGYEVVDEIGRGGMGVVYRVRDLRLNRIVAMKMSLAGELADDADVIRFRFEAEAAARLQHDHIVPIYELGQIVGHDFFTMRLLHDAAVLGWQSRRRDLLLRRRASKRGRSRVRSERTNGAAAIPRSL